MKRIQVTKAHNDLVFETYEEAQEADFDAQFI